MTGVHLRKPLGGADVRQQVAWRGHRVGWSLDLRVERLQVDGQSFLRAIFLVNDHDGVAPVSGFCDWFNDAFCHHVVELLLDLLAVGVRDWTGCDNRRGLASGSRTMSMSGPAIGFSLSVDSLKTSANSDTRSARILLISAGVGSRSGRSIRATWRRCGQLSGRNPRACKDWCDNKAS